jgi:hypothetical protein
LRIDGWCLNPGKVAYNFELRQGRRIVATGPVLERPDIGEAFPGISHAWLSGFAVDASFPLAQDEPLRFDLIALQEIAPVGVIPILYVDGLDLGASTAVYELLRPIARRRSIDSLRAVVEWPGGGSPLKPAIERLLPGAAVGAGEGDGHADLVVAHGALWGLDADGRLELLERLRPLLDSAGLLAVTVEGELARPFATDPGDVPAREEIVRAFGALFDVVDYVEGGVGSRYDLVVLKSR